MTEIDMARKAALPNSGRYLGICLEGLREPRKYSVKMSNVPAEIRTGATCLVPVWGRRALSLLTLQRSESGSEKLQLQNKIRYPTG
jgi:hypothetical protein